MLNNFDFSCNSNFGFFRSIRQNDLNLLFCYKDPKLLCMAYSAVGKLSR